MGARIATALHFDGKSSRALAVEARWTARGELEVRGDGITLDLARSALRVREGVGQAGWSIELEDGAVIAFEPTPESEALLAAIGSRRATRLVNALERHWRWAIGASVLVLIAAWAFVVYGLPALARRAVILVPHAVERSLGEHGLGWIDELLGPSALDAARGESVAAAFERVAATVELPEEPRLELRGGRVVGANAFALPGGIVVMTDELVGLAESDEELAAVFAHELGHVAHRHALRQLLQSSTVGMITTVLTGEVSAVTSLGVSIPTVLLEAGFSRDMEREADGFALECLDAAGIARERLATILERLESESGSARIPELLSTHPATSTRADDARR